MVSTVSTPKPTSWLPDFLASVAAMSGIGYLATAYTVSRWLTRSTREPFDVPSFEDCTLEDVECCTSDGLRLAGWVLTPPEPRATVALFHGMRGNRARTLNRCDFLTRAGYRCVLFDHRGHGQSEGRCTSFGYYEGRDVDAVLDVIARRWPDQPRAAIGISMGAAALCYAAGRSRDFDALILESLYHDLMAAFTNRVGGDYPLWFHRFSKGVVWVTERRLGLRMHQMMPTEYIHDLGPTPVLLLTGDRDPHAPPDDLRLIYERCQEPRELQIIPGAGHTDVCEIGGDHYRYMVLDFLERRLKNSAVKKAA